MQPDTFVRLVFAAIGVAVCGLACGEDISPPATLCRPDARGLVINEWLANPSGPDGSREWIELYNEGDTPVCLERAQLRVHTSHSAQKRTLLHVGCLPPRGFLLLGDGTLESRVAAQGYSVDQTLGPLELPNTGATIAIACQQHVLAQVSYGPHGESDAPAPLPGRATARVDDRLGQHSFCNVSTPPYDNRDRGTPGGHNLGCALCREAGRLRAQLPAHANDVAVTAVYADPPGVDRNHEWVRLHSRSREPVDLLGMALEVDVLGRKRRRFLLATLSCSPLLPHETVQIPILDSACATMPPAFVGPTLPNQDAWYRLFWGETLVHESFVPAPERHACVLPLATMP